MSNVKEAYKVVFGPEGSKRTNRVLHTLKKEGQPDNIDFLAYLNSARWRGTQYLTAGDFPFSLETFQKLKQ